MIARPISDYRTLVETFRARADELELSRAEIDRLGGMPDGYSGKLLGRAATAPGANKKKRRMLPTSLDSVLGVLGLKARELIGYSALQFAVHLPLVLLLLWVLGLTLDYHPPAH